MMSPLIYLAFLLGFVFCDDTIVIPPTKLDSSLPQKLLIFIPGGKVPNQNYTLTAQSIQSSSNLRLWVVIIAPTQRLCIIECGTSFLCSFLHSTIESAVGKAKAAGYSGEDSGSDVFLAAHSLGGICANTLMKAYKNPYAGVILMGSTPDENGDYDLLNYPAPILTLNVELDFAQARPGKTSHWFRQFQQLASIKGKNATLAAKPLIVLRGMDHSDFCPGFQVPGDLFSEVTREQALSAIGTTVAAFLHQHTSQNETIVAKSLNILSSLFDSTEELMKPIITALDLEVDGGEGLFHGGAKSTWCQISQHQLSALPPNLDARVIVTDTYQNTTSNLNSCSAAGKVSGTNVLVNSCSLGTYYSDSFNTGNIVAAQQISCKLLSPTQIAKLLATAPSTNSSCLLINKYAVQLAESLVLPRTLQRYQAKGRPIKLLADQVVSSDSDWQSKDLTWTESTQNVEVAALAYITDTEGDCKVLSPARVIDWMMTDSLKSSS